MEKEIDKRLYLVTRGDGADGNEWILDAIYTKLDSALSHYRQMSENDKRNGRIEVWEADSGSDMCVGIRKALGQ